MFPTTKLFHVANSVSDHSMLILKNEKPIGRRKKRTKLFRFESMWLRDERCFRLVTDAWEKGKQISELQRKLQLLENMRGGDSTLEDIHAIKELNRWLYMEEDMWHQRSRNNWLSVGDKNTTFFHTKASNQWQRNSINRVLDSNNTWQEDEEQIGKTFVNYYEQQFLSSRPVVEEALLEAIHTKVTDRMNASLLRNFNAQEVEKALQQMHPLKAPGLDMRINGHPCGKIQPTWGLRQGDPPSPYLFLICVEGLSALLQNAVQQKKLKGVAASTKGPKVSHLFFADDSIIFRRATREDAIKIQRLLQVYKASSGQQLNKNKTSLFFSPNMDDGIREDVKTMFEA
ncbi:uncharacterized protein LOC115964516 [Quercus lobata]|uniref:uncharacterized protein LOC115964516 n=1 Tax=Quercus lobata TaxID=97700 RepID=UPI00124427D6|nr:uncharacterized protein LOC115964516 [Quercus lobata]